MPGIVEKPGVVTMLTRTVDIAFQDDGLHVVVENAPGNPAHCGKGFLVAVNQGADFHVDHEFDVTRPAVAKRGAEGVERMDSFAEFNPVDLQLLTRRRLETHHRVFGQCRLYST